jgi:hypothetical protein
LAPAGDLAPAAADLAPAGDLAPADLAPPAAAAGGAPVDCAGVVPEVPGRARDASASHARARVASGSRGRSAATTDAMSPTRSRAGVVRSEARVQKQQVCV